MKDEYKEDKTPVDEMKATMPATVVYAVSSSKLDEWRQIRKTMVVMLILGFIVLFFLAVIGVITYSKLVHILEVGIKVRYA